MRNSDGVYPNKFEALKTGKISQRKFCGVNSLGCKLLFFQTLQFTSKLKEVSRIITHGIKEEAGAKHRKVCTILLRLITQILQQQTLRETKPSESSREIVAGSCLSISPPVN